MSKKIYQIVEACVFTPKTTRSCPSHNDIDDTNVLGFQQMTMIHVCINNTVATFFF